MLVLCHYTQAFSSCSKQGLLSSFHAWLLIEMASLGAQRRLTGLAVLRHVGSSRSRGRTCVPCIGKQILHHWITREVLIIYLVY